MILEQMTCYLSLQTSLGCLHFHHFHIYWPHCQGRWSVKKNDWFYYLVVAVCWVQEGETYSSKILVDFLKTCLPLRNWEHKNVSSYKMIQNCQEKPHNPLYLEVWWHVLDFFLGGGEWAVAVFITLLLWYLIPIAQKEFKIGDEARKGGCRWWE